MLHLLLTLDDEEAISIYYNGAVLGFLLDLKVLGLVMCLSRDHEPLHFASNSALLVQVNSVMSNSASSVSLLMGVGFMTNVLLQEGFM